MNYYDFAAKYRVQNIRTVNSYKRYDYGVTASEYLTHSDKEQLIEMEMPEHSFRKLIEVTNLYEKLSDSEWREDQIRRQYPDVAEAYSRYQVLLALVK